ncbi:hypothetical protein ACOTDT_23860 [Achromobacter xylosoxidans]
MKSEDALIGVASRTNGKTMDCASTLRFSAFQADELTFEVIFHGLIDEFPAFRRRSPEHDESEMHSFDCLFPMLIEQLKQFPEKPEAQSSAIIKILALSAFLEREDQLWQEVVKTNVQISATLIDKLKEVFIDSRVDSRALLANANLNEQQTNLVLREIVNKDWRSVEWTLDRLWPRTSLRIKQTSGAALFHLAPHTLVGAIDKVEDFFDITSYISRTPSHHHLQIAVASSNWTFKFWALQQSVVRAAAGEQAFDEEWEALLVEAAQIPVEWARWMGVMNEFPSRYPAIQPALGRSLSGASVSALEGYLTPLSMEDFSRPAVTVALEAFKNCASETVRKVMWAMAFKRWQDWAFGTTEESTSLFRVTTSALDFAVVGYFIECADSQERAAFAADLARRAQAMEHDWHPNESPMLTERFKLISSHQLLAHAESVVSNQQSWLPSDTLYRPSWEDGSLYRSFKYDRGLSGPAFLIQEASA